MDELNMQLQRFSDDFATLFPLPKATLADITRIEYSGMNAFRKELSLWVDPTRQPSAAPSAENGLTGCPRKPRTPTSYNPKITAVDG